MITLNICLDDIPGISFSKNLKESPIKVSDKNGKHYIELIVNEKKEVGQFGDTHSIHIGQSKKDRDGTVPKVYVGNGTEKVFQK